MNDLLQALQVRLTSDQIPALGEIEEVQQQVAQLLETAIVEPSIGITDQMNPVRVGVSAQASSDLADRHHRVLDLMAFILAHDVLKTPALLNAVALALSRLNPSKIDQRLLDLLIQFCRYTHSGTTVQENIVRFLTIAIHSASSYQQLKSLVNTIIHVADAIKLSELPHKLQLEQAVFEKLVPRLLDLDRALEVTNLLQWLRYHATGFGLEVLYRQLIQIIHDPELQIESFQAVLDFAFTKQETETTETTEAKAISDRNSLELEDAQLFAVQTACIERMVIYLADESTNGPMAHLLISVWPLMSKPLRVLLVQQLPEAEAALQNLPSTPQVYQLIVEMIPYTGLNSTPDIIQSALVKVALGLTQTKDQEDWLRTVLQQKAFYQFLLPRSLWLISVWFLLRPLADLIPNSKTGQIVKALSLPHAPFPSLPSFLFVFEHVLSSREVSEGVKMPNQLTQMKRAFLNAVAQLLDTQKEEVVEATHRLLQYLVRYLRGVDDAERQSWQLLSEQVWLVDAGRPTADVDRIRHPEVSKQLQQQIKQIFGDVNVAPLIS
ncbi:MAG: hypothetical protein QGH37_11630 [Candidatus Poribacteria bacterium]|jgi:hypothetical protein|nr:hypothetical protein [Candidatus Poribacteria bacterium]MDP6960252.1 hypothetical protein [Dehalococcoidia bacterium]